MPRRGRNGRNCWPGQAASPSEPWSTPNPTEDASDEPGSATLHGLYWFTANLVSRSPVLMIIDDVQWADVASLRWLAYLAQRIDGLNLLLLLAVRPRHSDADEQLWDSLAGVPEFETIRPRGLTPDGVARLTQDVVSLTPEPEFVAACHQLTRGNPFLIRELLGELAAARGGADRGECAARRTPDVADGEPRGAGPAAPAAAGMPGGRRCGGGGR